MAPKTAVAAAATATAAAPAKQPLPAATIPHLDTSISLHQTPQALHADIWRFCSATLPGWKGLSIKDAEVRGS